MVLWIEVQKGRISVPEAGGSFCRNRPKLIDEHYDTWLKKNI